MNFETAHNIYQLILKTKQTDLREDLIKSAIRYAHICVQWSMLNRKERNVMEVERTRAHNAFIDNCNILSRNMGKNNEDNKWKIKLGEDRKTIGNFACFLHLIKSIEAR